MAKTTQRMEKLAQEIHKEGHRVALLEMRQWIDHRLGKATEFPCHYCGRKLKSKQGRGKHERTCLHQPKTMEFNPMDPLHIGEPGDTLPSEGVTVAEQSREGRQT